MNIRSNGGGGAEAQLKGLMLGGLDGDRAAYANLLRRLTPFLRGYFRKRLGSGADEAEDLLQETLLAIHLKRDTFDRAQPLTPWVYGIARYKMLDHFRRVGVRRAVPLDDAGDLFAQENPEEGAVRHDVRRLLAALPGRQAKLLREVKLTGLSMEEAASENDMTVTAVKVSVHRGLRHLIRKVEDENR